MELMTTITLAGALIVGGGANWPHNENSQYVGTVTVSQDLYRTGWERRFHEIELYYQHQSFTDDPADRGFEEVGIKVSTSW